MKKKEDVLRKTVKGVVRSIISAGHQFHLSWIESHATALGFPDINYCCYGTENDLELKAGPDYEVLASQVAWFKERIDAGGWPLFLVQWGDVYMIVPGDRATDIRRNGSEENTLRCASTIWKGKMPDGEFLKVLRNPKREYERNKDEQD